MSIVTRSIHRPRPAVVLNSLSTYHVAAVAVFAGTFILAVLPRFDTDLWWHLYVGRDIVNHMSVPTRDFLSYTFRGKPWIDHEWLAESFMYLVYRISGMYGVLTLFGSITTAAYITVYAIMRYRGVGSLLALTLTLIAAIASLGSWGPRIQMVTLLFAALFCLVLERRQSMSQRTWIGLLVGLMLLWSNLHGGFVIGLLLVFVYLAGSVFDGLKRGWSFQVSARSQRPLALALLLCLVVTLVNPNTYHQLIYPLRFVLPNTFTNAIQESQAPNFHLVQLLPFEFLLIGLLAVAFLARRRVSWVDVLITVLLTHLALQQTRNIPLWAVLVSPILGVYLQDAIQPLLAKLQKANRPLRARSIVFANWGLVGALVIGAVVLTGRTVTAHSVASAEHSTYPAGGIRYLSYHHMSGHVFNSYSYGGYMLWKLNAQYPTFIDSRADTVFSEGLLRDYLTLYNGLPGWHNVLQKYAIKWVFVERSAPIAKILASRNMWQIAFQGRLAAILVRR